MFEWYIGYQVLRLNDQYIWKCKNEMCFLGNWKFVWVPVYLVYIIIYIGTQLKYVSI